MPTSLMAFVSIRVIRVTRDIVYLISAYVLLELLQGKIEMGQTMKINGIS